MPTRKPKSAPVAVVRERRKSRQAEGASSGDAFTLDEIGRAMSKAAKDAVEENDRLGIPTPGAGEGGVVSRQPRPTRRTKTRSVG